MSLELKGNREKVKFHVSPAPSGVCQTKVGFQFFLACTEILVRLKLTMKSPN